MKKVDTAKIRRIITWIIILIVLFILLTGLCLFIFSMEQRMDPIGCVKSVEGVELKAENKNMDSAKINMDSAKINMGSVNKNMDSDDLENAMKEMESNR